MKQVINLSVGTIICGKWNKKSYKVVRKLGGGAIGQVYLVDAHQGLCALKISEDTMSITSEVTVLKKVQGSFLGPFLYDVDDWSYEGKFYYFYVMEYISGELLLPSVKKRGIDWTIVYLVQMLKDLEVLHQQGYIFGDVKPDNIIISDKENRIRFLDVGGITQQGRSVKEYTEFFDRGYWELGSRKAEPSYDLFAIGMILVSMEYPEMFAKGENTKQTLLDAIQKNAFLTNYQKVIKKALFIGYHNCAEMRSDLMEIITGKTGHETVPKQPVPPKQVTPHLTKKKQKGRKREIVSMVEVMLLLLALISGWVWYLYH